MSKKRGIPESGIRGTDLDRLVEGQVPDQALVDALIRDPSIRRNLAAKDPSAIFSVLGAVPLARPLPERPVLAPRRRRGGLRAALAAAAAVLICVGALAINRSQLENNPQAAFAAADTPAETDRYYQVVSHVDSPTAQVIVLVPPSAKGPTVTLIVDEEVDL